MNKRKLIQLMGVLIICNISLFIFTISYFNFNGTSDISEKADKINQKYNIQLSATHELEWSKTWGGSSLDWGSEMVINNLEEIFIAGYSYNYGAGGSDMLLLKYKSSGDLEWYKTWGGADLDEGSGIALDTSGNIFITGGTKSYGAGNYDTLLAKYDSSGNQIWYKTWGTSNIERGVDIVLDNLGNIYITGFTDSYGAGIEDMVLLKYNSSGNLEWYKTWGGSDFEHGHGIALDASGNVFITGYTESYGTGGRDVFLLKYDSDGNLQWYKIWGGSNNDHGFAIAVDGLGNVFITGETESYGEGYKDAFLLKYDTSGILQWNKTWGGSDSDRGMEIILDNSGQILITGGTYNYGAVVEDMVLIKYDTSGNLIWNKTWGGAERDLGHGIALDVLGNIFVSGAATINSGGSQANVFLLKYEIDTDGVTPSITVTNPTSSNFWDPGSSYSITWSSMGSISSVKIELYAGMSLESTITYSTSNDGSYSWSIPSSTSEGINYRIKITDVSNSSVYDYSSDFSILDSSSSIYPVNNGFMIIVLITIVVILGFSLIFIYLRLTKHKREIVKSEKAERKERDRTERKDLEKKEKEVRERREREEMKRSEKERLERERLEKERFEKERQQKITKEREILEKIRKAMNVSTRLKLDMMREFLEIDEQTFTKKVFDWASEFGFTIDGEYLIVNKETVSDFIDELDRHFDTWRKEEDERSRKI